MMTTTVSTPSLSTTIYQGCMKMIVPHIVSVIAHRPPTQTNRMKHYIGCLWMLCLLLLQPALLVAQFTSGASVSGAWTTPVMSGTVWTGVPVTDYPGSSPLNGATTISTGGFLSYTNCGSVPASITSLTVVAPTTFVQLNGAGTMTIAGGLSIGSGEVSLSTGLNLAVNGALTLVGTGTITVLSGATLALNGDMSLAAAANSINVQSGGTLIISNSCGYNGSGGKIRTSTGSGLVILRVPTINGTIFDTNFNGTVQVSSSVLASGTLLLGGAQGKLDLNTGNYTINSGASLMFNSSTNPAITGIGLIRTASATSTMTIASTSFNGGKIPVSRMETPFGGSLALAPSGALNLSLDTNLVLGAQGGLFVNNNTILSIDSGRTLTHNGTGTPALQFVGAAGRIDVKSGGRLTLNTPTANAVVTGGAGNLTSNAGSTITLGTAFNNNQLPTPQLLGTAGNRIFGLLEIANGAPLDVGAFTYNVAATGRVRVIGNSPSTGAGSFVYASGAVLEYSDPSTGTVPITTGVEFPPSMTASVQLNKASGGVVTLQNAKTTAAATTLSFTSNTTLNLNSQALTVAGNADFRQGSILSNNASSLAFTGTATAGSFIKLQSPPDMRALIVNPSAATTLGLQSDLNLNGVLAPSGLTIGSNGTLISQGATTRLTNPAGISIAAGGEFRADTTGGVVLSPSTTIVNNGRMLFNNKTTLDIQPNAGTVTGSLLQFAPGSTLLYSGPPSTARTVGSTELPAPMTGNVVVRNPLVLQTNTNFTVNGSFALDPVNLKLPMNGIFTLNGAITFGNGSDVQDLAPSTFVIGGTGGITGTLNTPTSMGLTNLTMNRVGAQIALGTPLNITGILTMQNGNIISTATNLLSITNSASSAVNGGAPSSFVVGPLVRRIAPGLSVGGNSFYSFPLGKSGTFLPFNILSPVTGGSTSDVRVEAFSAYHGGAPGGTLQSVSVAEYWTTNVVGPFTSGLLQISSPSITPTSAVAASSSISGTYQSAGGTYTEPNASFPNGRTTSSQTPLAAAFTVGNVAPRPVVTSVFRDFGGAGTTATIVGTGLTGTTSVHLVRTVGTTLSSTAVQSLFVIDDRAVRVTLGTIMVDQPTAFSLSLRTNGGSTTSTVQFTYYPVPIITNVAPLLGSTGSTVTITGRNFVTTATMEVSFGGNRASSVSVLSTTSIVATVGAGGTGAIVVTNPGAQGTTTATFTYVEPPTITRFEPPVGSEGTVIGIFGKNLNVTTSATFGLVPANIIGVVPDGNVVYARLGKGATGAVQLRWPGGVVTASGTFVYGSTPAITDVSPLSGTNGTLITVTGANLVGVTNVQLGSVAAPFITQADSLSATQTLKVFVPLNTTGGTLTVRASGGTATSQQRYTVLPSFTINSISPSSGTAGTIVTINGANFTTVASLSIAGVPALVVSSSATQIRAIVGNVVATSGTVTISASNGTVSSTFAFTRAPVEPIITGLPSTMAITGTVFTVNGRFFTGVQEVTVGGVSIPEYRMVSSTQLTFLVPPNATNGTLTVRTPGGTATTSSSVTVITGVFITAFEPPFGGPGAQVRILGGNFLGATQIRFGDLVGTIDSVLNNSTLLATPPPGAQTNIVTITAPIGIGRSPAPFPILNRTQLDSAALAIIYDSTDGRNWRGKTGWLTAPEISDWSGIKLDNVAGNLRVTQLDLSGKELKGVMPASALRLLDAMRSLNFSNNALTGTVPNAAPMKQLEELQLANNKLTGSIPDTLASLPKLRVLDVSGNQLSGSLPASLCRFAALEDLNLSGNRFAGEIPRCIGTLGKLRVLNLGSNQFTGTIPSELGNLTALRELLLGANKLTGAIPSSLGTSAALALGIASSLQKEQPLATLAATPALERLHVNDNELSGELPTNLGTLRSLQELNVANNRLTSTALNTILTPLTNLRALNLAGNRFGNDYQDSLPNAIRRMISLEILNLRNNRFTGPLPTFLADLFALRQLLLDSNRFNGEVTEGLSIFSALETLSLSHNQLTVLTQFRFDFPKEVNVIANRLTFASLERNIGRDKLLFIPQDSIGPVRDTTVVLGTRVRFSTNIPNALIGDEQTTQYQWIRNGVPIGSPRSQQLYEIPIFTAVDSGSYVCRITTTRPAFQQLTLHTRPLFINYVRPDAPTQKPRLLFPASGSSFISTAPQLEWSRVPNATQYEVQASLQATFTDVATTATVQDTVTVDVNGANVITGLRSQQLYFWRVRGINPGSRGPWSDVSSFTTAPPGSLLTVNSLDFGKVVLDEIATLPVRISNLTSSSIQVLDIVANDRNLEFIPDRITQLTIPANRSSFAIPVRFAPKNTGYKSASATLYYLNGGRRDSIVFQNQFIGRGTPLKVVAAQFDTVRLARPTLTTAMIINRGKSSVRFDSVTISNTAAGSFTIEQLGALSARRIFLGSLDTTTLVLRSTATRTGELRGNVRVFATIDSSSTAPATRDTADADIFAVARDVLASDVTMTVGVRPVRDSIAPSKGATGSNRITDGLVTLELYIATGDTAKIRNTLGSQFFQATVRYDRNVLTYNNQRLNQSGYRASNSEPRMMTERVLFGERLWNNRRLIDTIAAVSVAGDVETTALFIESFTWRNPSGFNGRVFVELPTASTFTAVACKAGGTRLVGTTTSTKLIAAQPNPVKDVSRITYAARENGFVSIEIFDTSGKRVGTLASGYHESGAYETMLDARLLPSGSYFLVLTSPSEILTQRVEIVK